MARGKRGRYITRTMVKGANSLVELCIQSMAPNVVADVTAHSKYIPESIAWTFCDNRFIGYRELSSNKSSHGAKRPDDWDARRELESEYGRRFWTDEGMLGRLRGLSVCYAFAKGSLVDHIALFITSEVNIAFLDFRKVFQYIYGVNDIELYAALKELIQRSVIVVASVHDRDDRAVGPFTLHAAVCSKEACLCSYSGVHDKTTGKGTWFCAIQMTEAQIDGLLMRMFAYCCDDLKGMVSIEPFDTIRQCYEDAKGSLDACYGYLHELLMIKTRDIDVNDYIITDKEYEDQVQFVQLLDNTIHRNLRRIQKAFRNGTNPDEYIYIPNTFSIPPSNDTIADDADIQKAIQLLQNNMDSLRKDKKTGKAVNAEKVHYVFNMIPKVFPLKTLYEIFKHFDTDAEVVRRDVRTLCRKNQVIAIERGMYCSKQYADEHFSRVGRNPAEEKNILESCINSTLKELSVAMDLLCKSLANLTENNEDTTESDRSLESDS